MDIRITPQTILSRALAASSRQTSKLGSLQEQAATGKKLIRPSDDPGNINALLHSKTQESHYEATLGNLREARSSLDQSVSTLTDAGQVLQQARTLAIEGAQSTNSLQAREAIASQIDRLLERLIDLGNTQRNGRYLFSGTAAHTQPFVVTGKDNSGRPTEVTYQGGNERDAVLVSRQQTIPTLYSGQDAFQLRERGATLFAGSTGAKAGTGTDSAIGFGTLEVRHTATTFAAGSGVQAGTGSAAGDTIIGPAGAHQLTIVDTSGTGAFGTVSLNGGLAVAFTNANTNLAVTGASGEVIHLDTTAITAGFNGSVAITATGSLSVDGGASFTPIDYSPNQSITHSVDGSVTNVDSTAIRRAGMERLEYTGTTDAFQTLMALRDDLRNTRALSESDVLFSISRRVGELDRVREGVLGVVGDQASNLQNLDQLEVHLEDLQLTTRKWISELEDADLAEVVVQLQFQENLLQLTLGATARVMDISLLDFLR